MLPDAFRKKSCIFCPARAWPFLYTPASIDTEWEWTSFVSGYLKLLVEITDVFSGNKCPIAIAAILDPRYKIQLGSNALDWMKEVAEDIKEIFDAYSVCSRIVRTRLSLDWPQLT
ncbi:hypothetical protein ACE6H2_014302 [Prunus campanulata]